MILVLRTYYKIILIIMFTRYMNGWSWVSHLTFLRINHTSIKKGRQYSLSTFFWVMGQSRATVKFKELSQLWGAGYENLT
jgi:hypothetical protein